MIPVQDSGAMIPMQDSGAMIPMQDSEAMIAMQDPRAIIPVQDPGTTMSGVHIHLESRVHNPKPFFGALGRIWGDLVAHGGRRPTNWGSWGGVPKAQKDGEHRK